VQRRRVTQTGRRQDSRARQIEARRLTRRDETSDETTQTQPVAVSTARGCLLLYCTSTRRDSRADPATLLCAAKRDCTQIRRHAEEGASWHLDHPLCLRRADLHHPVRPVRAVLPADLSPTAHGRMKPLSGTASSTTTPVSAVPPYEASEEWCGLPIERATSNGRAIQALSHAPIIKRCRSP
jgi:hypothetical protein